MLQLTFQFINTENISHFQTYIHVDQKIIIARLNYYASADDASLKNLTQQELTYEY